MKIQQIRNATIRIECAGKHFLIDPWFQKKGTGMSAPSPDPEKAKIPSPTTELPFPVEQIMEGIDAMIVTHIHPDHFDPETAAMLDKSIPVFAVNEETKSQIEGFGYTSVMVLKDEGTDFDGVVLIRTEAMHGESPDQAAGPVWASFFKRLRSLSCMWLGILCTIKGLNGLWNSIARTW